MNIQINTPCHEDWQKMNPTQQGAFCKVCTKEVVDFSKKSIAEIKDFFSKEHKEKICGRFETKQLEFLSFDAFFASFKYWNLSKKLAVIFFFTLNLGSFSAYAQKNCTPIMGKVSAPQMDTVKKQKPDYLVGDIAIAPLPKDTVKKQTKKSMPVKRLEEPMVMGMIAVPKPKPVKKK
jgi:hypothetical protein